MRLTKKIVLVILLLCIVFSSVIFLLFRVILHDSSQEQKTHFVERVIAGVTSVFEKETKRILTFTADWASWDTMYDYTTQPTAQLEQNLAIMRSIRDGDFSLLVAVKQNKEILRTEGYSHLNKQSIQFDLLQQKKEDTWKFIEETFDMQQSIAGIVQSEFGPIIVVSSPIFHSDTSGPQNGRLLMGRLIDQSFAERITKVITWKTQLLIGPQQNYPKPGSEEKWLVQEQANALIIYYPISDPWNRHLLTIRIDARAHSFEILTKTANLFFLVLVVMTLLLGGILYFIMDRLVVRRVKRISSTTNHIISLDDLSQRIQITESYNDEITQLSHHINEMLKRLQTENITKEEVERMAMLNEKLIFLGRVTTTITHEINNPLFAIENSMKIIKKRLPRIREDKRLNEVVQVVEKEIKRVKTITGNIHKFAIPAVDKTRLSDITAIMDAAIKVIKWSKQLKNTSIDYLKQDHPFPLYSNPEALQQVFINIILNAIEAMEGKGRLVIDVLEKQEIDTYRIDFIDNGPGFSDTIKAEIFEPFKSTKPGKGTGLGLNISYHIIKNHGGTITLDENYHQGAHLIIEIPKGGLKNDGKANTTDR